MTKTEDTQHRLTEKCECGVLIDIRLRHWETMKCVCGRIWWALQPAKNGPFKLFLCANNQHHPWEITLTREQLEQAKNDAKANNVDTKQRGLTDRFSPESWGSNRLENDTNSRSAEIAVAAKLGLPLNSYLKNERGADVGNNIQVRQTHHWNGVLIIRPGNEHPDHIYVLVLRRGSLFRLSGWIWAKEGMHQRYQKQRKESLNWEIPQQDLHSMDTLPKV